MSWMVVGGMAAVGAVQGAEQRRAQKQANQQQANAAAAQTEFSPWTGQAAGEVKPQAVTGSALGGAVQGGLAGAMYGKANPADKAPEMVQGATDVAGTPQNLTNAPMASGGLDPLQAEEERLRQMQALRSGQTYG